MNKISVAFLLMLFAQSSLGGDVTVQFDDSQDHFLLNTGSNTIMSSGFGVATTNVLDQSQTNKGTTGSAYVTAEHQTFMAEQNGYISRVSVCCPPTVSGTLRLHRGPDRAINLEWQKAVVITQEWQVIPVEPPVQVSSGSVMSLAIDPGSPPNHFDFRYVQSDIYPGGEFSYDSPSDLAFKIWVCDKTPETEFSGSVSAGAFVGDGSGLTHLGDADTVDGIHASSFLRRRLSGFVPAGTTTNILVPHFSSFTLLLACEHPQVGGIADLHGFENDLYMVITYTKYDGSGVGTTGAAEAIATSTTDLLSFGSGFYMYYVRSPGFSNGNNQPQYLSLITTNAILGMLYQLIY